MNKQSILLVGNFLSARVGTRSVGEELSMRLAQKGWKTVETSSQLNRILRLLDMLFVTLTRKNQYQIAYVEVYSGMAFLWADVIARLLYKLGKSVILALHGGMLSEFAKNHPKRFAALLNQASAVVTPSLFLQFNLQAFCKNIIYLPNAVDINRYPFHPRKSVSPKIVWLRALHQIYHPEVAIQAIVRLRDEFPNISLLMIGPDKKDGSLQSVKQLIEVYGLESNVKIVGAVPKSEVPIWLKKGDIFLNTTRYESFGISVLEAALVGLPIVTTSVGELPYLWQHEHTAMLTPVNDPNAVANAIRRIILEPDLAEHLSINARRKAEQYDWSVVLPQWEALSEVLIKHG